MVPIVRVTAEPTFEIERPLRDHVHVDDFVRVIRDANLIERHSLDRIVFEDFRNAQQEVGEHARTRFARSDAVFRMELAEHRFGLVFPEWMQAMRDVTAAADFDDASDDRVVARFHDDIGSFLEDPSGQDPLARTRENAFLQAREGVADLIGRAQIALDISRPSIGIRGERTQIDRAPRREGDRVFGTVDDLRANDADVVFP